MTDFELKHHVCMKYSPESVFGTYIKIREIFLKIFSFDINQITLIISKTYGFPNNSGWKELISLQKK